METLPSHCKRTLMGRGDAVTAQGLKQGCGDGESPPIQAGRGGAALAKNDL